MIEIYETSTSLAVNGHANAGVKGESVPCEAVTAMINMFVMGVDHYQNMEYELESGHFYINLKQIVYVCDPILEALKLGLQSVAEAYPEYISYVKA